MADWIVLKFWDHCDDRFDSEGIALTTSDRWARVRSQLEDSFPAQGAGIPAEVHGDDIIYYSCAQEFISRFSVKSVSEGFAKEFALVFGEDYYYDWYDHRTLTRFSEWRLKPAIGALPRVWLHYEEPDPAIESYSARRIRKRMRNHPGYKGRQGWNGEMWHRGLFFLKSVEDADYQTLTSGHVK